MKYYIDTCDIMTMEFALPNLKQKESDLIKYIVQNPKVREVTDTLLSNERLYFNELHKKIGGNRATIADILDELEEQSAIIANWEIKEIESRKSTPTSRAVKSYQINNECEPLLNHYKKWIEA